MNYPYDFVKTIDFLPLAPFEVGTIVWVKWGDHPRFEVFEQAVSAVVRKIYDDGNILYVRPGQDHIEFAFAKDIYAKTPPQFMERLRYRSVRVSDITEALKRRITNAD